MKELYKKELKSYFNNFITYLLLAIMLLVNGLLFIKDIFSPTTNLIRIVNFALPLYTLIAWIVIAIPILLFLIYYKPKEKKEDTRLYTSNLSSFEIVVGKTFAITSVFLIFLGIVFLSDVILQKFIYKNAGIAISLYVLVILIILNSAAFSNIIYNLFKNQWISIIVAVLIQSILLFLFKTSVFLEDLLFMPFLQGVVPIVTSIIFLILFVIQTAIAILLLNKKRNIF